MNRNPGIHRQPSGDVDIAFVDAADAGPADAGASPASVTPAEAAPTGPGESVS
ncbi:hypothetical protein [Frankia sp. AgKG'84/4]|uniref:hypothetical protein n=1 Tax=Frankia sp. AgKG'84/4 TaxID=573490 RepID=UPI0020108809|nr:hypothetical protein [Frankia sp. AgKG'84/4]MCL9796507.1 hypothetical protein [Frankia sp. AgKG'84/4]